jgi:hypothetical protein
MDPDRRQAGFQARRAPLLLLGAVALVAGLWTGLGRLGALAGPLPLLAHGPLMVSAFLGTVIALERAVAARSTWAFLGPMSCGVGGVLLLAGQPLLGAVLLTVGSVVVCAVLARVCWQHPELHHGVLLLAALGWFAGNLALALGRPVFQVVPSWMLFLVGTIAAERLELTRVLRRSRAVVLAFTVLMALFATGAALSYAWPDAGFRMLSAGALGLAAWLFRYDIARRTIRQAELTRFIAAALLSGYAWLFVGGALGLWSGFVPAGPRYDAVLHAVFVGFVFSMIFGHAPIILPAVLGVKVPWRPRFYVHLVALHLAMGLRVAGDLLELHEVRKLGAWGSAVAIVLFIAGTAWAVIAQQPAVRRSPALPV